MIIVAVVTFLGPFVILLPQIRRIITKRTVEGLDLRGLQMGTTCTLGWLIYGVLNDLPLVWVVNLAGLALPIWITKLFMVFSTEIILKNHLRIPIIFSTFLLLVATQSIKPIGLICMVISFTSPIPQLRRAFKDLHLTGLSLLTYVNAIIVHIAWITYGLQNVDPNIIYPNIYGMTIAITLFFRIIRSRRTSLSII